MKNTFPPWVWVLLLLAASAFVAVAAGGDVINDLALPADYGLATSPASYDLAGLTWGDTRQGAASDCWWWATVASISHQRPDSLARNYAVNLDGTVNVTFFRNSLPITYQVTSTINPYWGDPNTTLDGANGNGASQIMQKAYAAFRYPVNTMADLNYGWPNESISAFGLTAGTLPSTISAFAVAWGQGDVIIVDTGLIVPPGAVSDHSDSVWSVDAAAGTAVLRSPWGPGYGGYDCYITVDDAWLSAYSVGSFYGQFGGAAPIPEPATLAVVSTGFLLLLKTRKASL
jgi:hypothetical protein